MQTDSPTLDQLLDEPIVRLMMVADRVDERDLRAIVARASEATLRDRASRITAERRPAVRLFLTGDA